ncbi:hypothetical protein NN561_016206 [Cricetulus griseus]
MQPLRSPAARAALLHSEAAPGDSFCPAERPPSPTSPCPGWRAPGPVLPSARRRDACTKDGSRLSFSAISSGKYFSSPIARTSDRARPGANPARSDAAVPGSRGDRPSSGERSSRAWGCAARAGTCFSRAPARLQPRPQLERLPARPAPACLPLEAGPGGGAPAEAAGRHWAGLHVDSPEWQEAAVKGRVMRSASALSWPPLPAQFSGLSSAKEPGRTAWGPGC